MARAEVVRRPHAEFGRGVHHADMNVLGVDGCTGGWVGVVLGEHGAVRAVASRTLPELLEQAPALAAVGIDIPIGLLQQGFRDADLAARAFLGSPRRSAVFVTPPRSALESPTYAEANQRCRAITGKGMSRQSWALAQRILEADRLRPELAIPIREAHPEVSFMAMAGAPLQASKRTWAGHRERHRLLATAGISLPDDLGPAGRFAGTADMLDAAAVAWTARRVATGTARPLPDPPMQTDDGHPIAIWF
jgi:predicted RNase H-like nuclease